MTIVEELVALSAEATVLCSLLFFIGAPAARMRAGQPTTLTLRFMYEALQSIITADVK